MMFNLISFGDSCSKNEKYNNNNKSITFHEIDRSDKWLRWFGFQFSNVTKFDIGYFIWFYRLSSCFEWH